MSSEGNLFDSFVALTGAKAESAESWLEMANFDLETAVQLFFENGDKPPQVSISPSLLNSIGNDNGWSIILLGSAFPFYFQRSISA